MHSCVRFKFIVIALFSSVICLVHATPPTVYVYSQSNVHSNEKTFHTAFTCAKLSEKLWMVNAKRLTSNRHTENRMWSFLCRMWSFLCRMWSFLCRMVTNGTCTIVVCTLRS